MENQTISAHGRKLPKLLAVGFYLAGIASVSGLGFMITKAFEMVQSGKGLETYRTFWLVEFNWISFLVLLVVTAVAIMIALVFRLREHLLWRSLEEKYGSKRGRV